MSSEPITRTTLKSLGNSLRKEPNKTKVDIELGPIGTEGVPAAPSGPNTSPTRLAKNVFVQIFETIQDKRYYHVDSEKRVVYRELMDHLDSVEATHRRFNFTLIAIELLVFSGLLTALICSLTMDRIKRRRFLHLRMWQYITMTMMIASGLSVIRFLTFVISLPVMWWWRIHKYVVYFIRQVKRCVDVTLWFCIVLFGWYVWFRPRLRNVHGDLSIVVAHQITRFLFALCLGSFLWLLKNILYLKLEADLHYDQLFERIRLSVIYLHGLQILHKRGMWRFLPDNKIKKKLMKMAMRKEHEETLEVEELMKGKNIWMLVMGMEMESVPIWILRRLAEEYLDQVKLRPLPGNSDITNDDKKILKEARKMFKQLVKEEKPHHFSDLEIKKKDLEEHYGLDGKELAFIFKPRIQEVYDEDEDEDEIEAEAQASTILAPTPVERTISYDEFLNWAIRAYKNCWGLERTLNSSKRVFIKLNRLMSTFLLMVVLIIWLLLSGIVNTGQLALLFTPFLAASFIFGDSCRKMFEGLIFAFAMHPFDVGDRVIVNNVQMRVTELNILTSVFLKYDTGEEVITPNSTLTTTTIINLDITPDQSDKVDFVVTTNTALEDIKDLEIKIKKFLDDDIEYSSNNKVVKSEVGKEEMKMIVYFRYLVSYLTAESKAVHKSKILSKIMEFRNHMDQNTSKKFPSSYQLYSVDIALHPKTKLKDIEHLKAEILRGLDERYKPNSKVVLTDLTRSKVKMGIYLYYSEVTKEDKEEKMPDTREGKETLEKDDKCEHDDIRHKWMKDATSGKAMKNLHDISETLKRIKNVVKDVTIYETVENGKVEVIPQGGIGWDSIKARIQSHEESAHPGSSLETIHSGGVHGNMLVLGEVNQVILDETTCQDT